MLSIVGLTKNSLIIIQHIDRYIDIHNYTYNYKGFAITNLNNSDLSKNFHRSIQTFLKNINEKDN